MITVTPEEYNDFHLALYKSLNTKSSPLRALRYGQAFCNHFSIHDPDLFYMENAKDAQNFIKEKYLSIDSC